MLTKYCALLSVLVACNLKSMDINLKSMDINSKRIEDFNTLITFNGETKTIYKRLRDGRDQEFGYTPIYQYSENVDKQRWYSKSCIVNGEIKTTYKRFFGCDPEVGYTPDSESVYEKKWYTKLCTVKTLKDENVIKAIALGYCYYCDSLKSKVINNRPVEIGAIIDFQRVPTETNPIDYAIYSQRLRRLHLADRMFSDTDKRIQCLEKKSQKATVVTMPIVVASTTTTTTTTCTTMTHLSVSDKK